MTPADTHTIEMVAALADVARKKGIRSLTVDGLVLEMGPLDVPAKPDPKQFETDQCACGHGLHEHQGGLCLRGCDVSRCVTEGSQ